MMLEKMVQDFARHLEAKLDEWANQLRQEWNVAQLQGVLIEEVDKLCARLLQPLLNEQLGDAEWLAALKRLGGRLGLRFKE
jgi:ABC-type taurine transport system substrate-binding protein